jgi:hypothetical protein
MRFAPSGPTYVGKTERGADAPPPRSSAPFIFVGSRDSPNDITMPMDAGLPRPTN